MLSVSEGNYSAHMFESAAAPLNGYLLLCISLTPCLSTPFGCVSIPFDYQLLLLCEYICLTYTYSILLNFKLLRLI